jgi:hypothetical protein
MQPQISVSLMPTFFILWLQSLAEKILKIFTVCMFHSYEQVPGYEVFCNSNHFYFYRLKLRYQLRSNKLSRMDRRYLDTDGNFFSCGNVLYMCVCFSLVRSRAISQVSEMDIHYL